MRQGARVGPRNLSRLVLAILRDSTSYGTCRMHMSIIQTLGMDNPDTPPEAQGEDIDLGKYTCISTSVYSVCTVFYIHRK